MKRHLVRAMFSGALVLGVAIISPTSVTATDDSGTTQYRPNVGVITREFGSGPLKIAKWAFTGTSGQASPTDAKLTLKVAKKSKKICRVNGRGHLVALKSGNCDFTLVAKSKTRGAIMRVPLRVTADATRR